MAISTATGSGQLKPSRRRTADGNKTMKAVAEIAGVSEATVSRFLSGGGPVHKETGRRIESAIHAIGYRKNRNAGALARGRSYLIGLSIGLLEAGNPFTAELLHAVVKTAERAGYGTLVGDECDFSSSACPTINAFLERRVDGLLIAQREPGTGASQLTGQLGVPAIIFKLPTFEGDSLEHPIHNPTTAGRLIIQSLLSTIDPPSQQRQQ